MKFSTKTTYGLRAMIKLADNWPKSSISIASIAQKEAISAKYLERLFSGLKKDRLIISEKGVNGGYRLSKDPKKISVFEVVRSLEGKMSPFHCLDENGKIYCQKKCDCGANKVLIEVQKSINKTLKNINLGELI